uniref:Uncharacterized protein n=1 Tax=Rhizophora mucronata TaxID=61149 RepID=A0A2P2NAW9_RHIMU
MLDHFSLFYHFLMFVFLFLELELTLWTVRPYTLHVTLIFLALSFANVALSLLEMSLSSRLL